MNSLVVPVVIGVMAFVVATVRQHRRSGRWFPNKAAWKSRWSADRKSPKFWLFYAAFFAAVLIFALLLPDPAFGWRVVEVCVFGALTMVGGVQFMRSLHRPPGSGSNSPAR